MKDDDIEQIREVIQEELPDTLDQLKDVIREEIADADFNITSTFDEESKARIDDIEREVRELSDKVDIVLNILTEEKEQE